VYWAPWEVVFYRWKTELLQKRLGRFDFISFNPHGQGTLDGFDRNDKRLVTIAGEQYAFHTIEGTAPDSYSLTNLQEGM
jgi:hypothetical protein